jgi:hypothetical protein
MASVTEANLTPDDVQRLAALLDVIQAGLKSSIVLLPPKEKTAPSP